MDLSGTLQLFKRRRRRSEGGDDDDDGADDDDDDDADMKWNRLRGIISLVLVDFGIIARYNWA